MRRVEQSLVEKQEEARRRRRGRVVIVVVAVVLLLLPLFLLFLLLLQLVLLWAMIVVAVVVSRCCCRRLCCLLMLSLLLFLSPFSASEVVLYTVRSVHNTRTYLSVCVFICCCHCLCLDCCWHSKHIVGQKAGIDIVYNATTAVITNCYITSYRSSIVCQSVKQRMVASAFTFIVVFGWFLLYCV